MNFASALANVNSGGQYLTRLFNDDFPFAAMIDKVRAYIEHHSLLRPGARVLVGVSGGVDSMTLLYVLLRLGYDASALHINYGLRGEASDKDAELVRETCAQYQIQFDEHDVSHEIKIRPPGGSIQALARRIRYEHFAVHASESIIDSVAVSHHRDDQAETVLLGLLRRSGFDGIAGMRAHRPMHSDSSVTLIRPFLDVRKNDIVQYASARGIPWREDASNVDRSFTRSRLRHDVLPALAELGDGDVTSELSGLAVFMQHIVDQSLPNDLPEELSFDMVVNGDVPIEPLLMLDPAVRGWYLLRLLRTCLPDAPIRRSSIAAIEKLLHGQTGKRLQFESGTVWRDRDNLRFVAREKTAKDDTDEAVGEIEVKLSSLEDCDHITSGRFGRLFWNRETGIPIETKTGPNEILVDSDKLSGKLTVRPWKAGDRFRPFGLGGSKKLKSFLTDEKVDVSRRKSVHVLCDDDRIVWVLGLRMDDRYRVRDDTTHVLHFSFDPEK